MIVNVAMLFEDGALTFGPRDEASRVWMANGGELHMRDPLYQLRRHWENRRVSRRDLLAIASHFERLLNRLVSYELWRDDTATGFYGHIRDVTFRVRACEYRNVVVTQELAEL